MFIAVFKTARHLSLSWARWFKILRFVDRASCNDESTSNLHTTRPLT